MDEEFKEEYYQTVKFFERDPSASNNPFYIKKYTQLNNQLANKMKLHNVNTLHAPQPITISNTDFSIFEKSTKDQSRLSLEPNRLETPQNEDGNGNPLVSLNLNIDNINLPQNRAK